MKRLIPAIALCASLSACNQGQVNTVSTQAVIGADSGFQAASKAGEDAVILHRLDKATYKNLNQRAHDALIALRFARQSANSADIALASANLAAAISALYVAAAPKGN